MKSLSKFSTLAFLFVSLIAVSGTASAALKKLAPTYVVTELTVDVDDGTVKIRLEDAATGARMSFGDETTCSGVKGVVNTSLNATLANYTMDMLTASVVNGTPVRIGYDGCVTDGQANVIWVQLQAS